MVVCVVFNPFTYDAQIIYVSDTIINAIIYAREIAKRLLEKEKFKGYKAICKVPNYSVNNTLNAVENMYAVWAFADKALKSNRWKHVFAPAKAMTLLD